MRGIARRLDLIVVIDSSEYNPEGDSPTFDWDRAARYARDRRLPLPPTFEPAAIFEQPFAVFDGAAPPADSATAAESAADSARPATLAVGSRVEIAHFRRRPAGTIVDTVDGKPPGFAFRVRVDGAGGASPGPGQRGEVWTLNASVLRPLPAAARSPPPPAVSHSSVESSGESPAKRPKAAASPPARPRFPTGFKLGAAVRAEWTDAKVYPARLAALRGDGTVDVEYDDDGFTWEACSPGVVVAVEPAADAGRDGPRRKKRKRARPDFVPSDDEDDALGREAPFGVNARVAIVRGATRTAMTVPGVRAGGLRGVDLDTGDTTLARVDDLVAELDGDDAPCRSRSASSVY